MQLNKNVYSISMCIKVFEVKAGQGLLMLFNLRRIWLVVNSSKVLLQLAEMFSCVCPSDSDKKSNSRAAKKLEEYFRFNLKLQQLLLSHR